VDNVPCFIEDPSPASATLRPNRWAALEDAEVDHRVPLFRVWSNHWDVPWPKLLDFWGLPNLQVVNRNAHITKSVLEARDRRIGRS
jgi:hypothetical protein